MSDWKIVREEFRSYTSLVEELRRRPNNKIMQSKHDSSQRGNKKWYGTESYKEAEDMITKGYLEVINKMQKGVKDQQKLNSKFLENVDHAIPHNAVVGYIPNVPAALQNLPQSMISINKKPMKRKTLQILYAVGGSCMQTRDYFEKAGVALLSAVDIIERCGIQTKIDMAFFTGHRDNEATFPTVCIKNYGERFSIQKVSFPLVHTSMFRRIGFKWLETSPGITKDFSWGYGTPLSSNQLEEVAKQLKAPNSAFISTAWINEHNCSVEEILNKLGVLP